MRHTLDVVCRYRFVAILLLVVLYLPMAALASERSPLDIVTESGTHRFDVRAGPDRTTAIGGADVSPEHGC